MEDRRVVFNVGGHKFEVNVSTLMRHPTSLLAKIVDTKSPIANTIKPDKNGDYFFDRNGRIFEIILDYYRTGSIFIPRDISEDIVRKEFKFFELEYPEQACQENIAGHEKQMTEDDEEEQYLKMPIEQRYNFAIRLVHSLERDRIQKGLNYLFDINEEIELTHKANENRVSETQLKQLLKLRKDCLYYIAFAYYRRNDNSNARKYIQKLFEIEPNSKKGKALNTLIGDTGNEYAKIGLVFVAVLSLTCYVGWRAWWSRAMSRPSF